MEARLDGVIVDVEREGDGFFFHVEKAPETETLRGRADSETYSRPQLESKLKEYGNIPLNTSDTLVAVEKLRTILVQQGWRVLPTVFWFTVGSEYFYIHDKDPERHQDIILGCYTNHLRPGEVRSDNFFERIQASKLILSALWVEGKKTDIAIYLTKEAAKPSDLLNTYAELLGLF